MTQPTSAKINDPSAIAKCFSNVNVHWEALSKEWSNADTAAKKAAYIASLVIRPVLYLAAAIRDRISTAAACQLQDNTKKLIAKVAPIATRAINASDLRAIHGKAQGGKAQNETEVQFEEFVGAVKDVAKNISGIVSANSLDEQASVNAAVKQVNKDLKTAGQSKPRRAEVKEVLKQTIYQQMVTTMIGNEFKKAEDINPETIKACRDKIVKAFGATVDASAINLEIRKVLLKNFGVKALETFAADYVKPEAVKKFIDDNKAANEKAAQAKLDEAKKLCGPNGNDGTLNDLWKKVAEADKKVADLKAEHAGLDTQVDDKLKAAGVALNNAKTPRERFKLTANYASEVTKLRSAADTKDLIEKWEKLGGKVSDEKDTGEIGAAEAAAKEAREQFQKAIDEKNKLVGAQGNPNADIKTINDGEVGRMMALVGPNAEADEAQKRAKVAQVIALVIDTKKDDVEFNAEINSI